MSEQRPTDANKDFSHTYRVGEDESRLAHAARYLGLKASQARRPLGNVREMLGKIWHDTTLESARMHSVGVLGKDERVDDRGTLHQYTLTRRKRPVAASDTANYKTLHSLFQDPSQDIEEDKDGELVDVVEGGSLTAAVFGIIKGTVGPAILYLPRGFSMSGWAVAMLSMLVATCSYLYSANRLLQCWQVEKQKMEKIDEIRALLTSPRLPRTGLTEDDALLAKSQSSTLLTYPELARRAFGPWAAIVQFGIAGMQFGVCLTYLIFVPQNLVESTRVLFDVQVESWIFLLGMVILEIPLAWIRDIRKLTPTNILATVLIAYGLISCLIIAFVGILQDPSTNILQHVEVLPAAQNAWYLFVGTSFFVFEGSITLLVPLQEAVFRPEDKEKFPRVNQLVTALIVVFYIFFAITCWASFGSSVKTALTASLPPGLLSTAVQFAYSIAVIFTYPLQAFPALEVVFSSTKDISNKNRNMLASLVTCSLGIVAYLAIDYLGNVVSLLGSLVGIPIALIYPPLMHNQLIKNSSQSTRILNYAVTGLGVVAMGAASFTTLSSWDKGAES